MSYQPIWDGRSNYGGKKKHPVLYALIALFLLGAAVFAALEVYIGVKSRGRDLGEGSSADIMVVFGCQLNSWGPSQTLSERLDTALNYLSEHPDMTVVLSGGQGEDEPSTEAKGMEDYLRAHGFEGTILLEENSHNTWQNVSYTIDLLKAEGYNATENILAVSSGFHLARIEMLFRRAQGGTAENVYTLPAPVSHKLTAVHMFFREPVGLVKSFVLDR